jgi:DNA repair exonuclease SbcCD ATPase subunit
MEKEQLEKKVEWLDEERRKALETIVALEKRLAKLENGQSKPTTPAKSLTTFKTRLDAFDEELADLAKLVKSQESGNKKDIQTLDKQAKQLEKSLQQDQKNFDNVLEDFRKEIISMRFWQKSLDEHSSRIGSLIGKVDGLDESLKTLSAAEQTRDQSAKSLEESSQQDAHRLTEMRNEVSALLPRVEAAARQAETMLITVRKMEKRTEDIALAEGQRKQSQDEFMERAALAEADRAHQWKDWGLRFQAIEKQSAEAADRLREFDSTEIALKRAEKTFEELVEKINRRVNELGEMQRLGDQRFRQEWSTFQADAQKRWANFTLTTEEQQRESLRLREKLAERVGALEESLREVQDSLQHLGQQNERNLQNLLELARDSLAENERFLNSNSR